MAEIKVSKSIAKRNDKGRGSGRAKPTEVREVGSCSPWPKGHLLVVLANVPPGTKTGTRVPRNENLRGREVEAYKVQAYPRE